MDTEKTYLAGISGGSDSMALLSLCVNAGLKLVVCMVNYNVRPTAYLEEQLVRNYCQQHQITCYVDYPVQKTKENFQLWAREARYEFYKTIYDKHLCAGLLLGHQLDDHLENYLMALERKSHGEYYGLKFQSGHHEMTIYRPLLKYRKKQLRQYCLDNEVPFHDDESNASDKYTRNRIRHSLVEKADDAQINKWLKEIEDLNSDLLKIRNYIEEKYHDVILISEYRLEDKKMRLEILRYLMGKNTAQYNYANDFLSSIDHSITTSSKGSIDVGSWQLVYEYNEIYLWQPKEKYCFVFEKVETGDYQFFKLSDRGKVIEGVTLTESDFPIKIRAYTENDEIALRYGHKKVSRFLIDRKIKKCDRYYWPVIENGAGEVVFVSDVGCDINHFSVKPSMFVIK